MKEKELKQFFHSLSDESRLKIVRMLMDNSELCVCDFMRLLKLSQPHVSFHIRVLKEAKIINCKKVGRWVYCSLNKENPLLNAVLEFIKDIELDKEEIGCCDINLEVHNSC
jgi:Predicted transcriptional regulators